MIHKNLKENYSKINIDAINDFYPKYYKNSKTPTETVGWKSKKEQNKRFEVLLGIGFENGETILDFGCGLGALYEYIHKHYEDFGYIGVDINQDFIDKCKKKYPKVNFKKINNISEIKSNYDWFMASGKFTVYTPIKNMVKTIKDAFKKVKFGIAINFLNDEYAKNSDLSAIRGYNKEQIYSLFSKEFKEFKEFHTVELYDDYIENDFTIYIKKANILIKKFFCFFKIKLLNL